MLKMISLPLLVTLGLFGAMVGVLAGTALTFPDGYPDPFAPYAAFVPGQPLPRFDPSMCEVQNDRDRPLNILVCFLYPKDGHFSWIRIRACKGVIQDVIFKADNLQVVDVLNHWKESHSAESDETPHTYSISWHGNVYMPNDVKMRISHQANIRYIWLGGQSWSETC
jgi:hypothetical protein